MLDVRQRTVAKDIERAFQKLEVETRTAAVAQALRLARTPDVG